jgi:Predicted Zn peptidase
MKIQRINPTFAAQQFLRNSGWEKPGDLGLEEMCNAVNIQINDVAIAGAEGRILMNRDNAVVAVNSAITHPGKRRFIIAHELGHFLMHQDLKTLFTDDDETLAEWHQRGAHEQEANEFASEILLPSGLFKEKVKGKKLNINLIEDVASYFGSSLTASFLKYRLLGDYPIMIVFIDKGVIKWKQHSRDFPFKFLVIGSRVPVYTVAGDYFNGNGLSERPEKIDAIEWFPEDFQIKYSPDAKLWEQCFSVSETGLVSCIWCP